jgi:hypothetical protein
MRPITARCNQWTSGFEHIALSKKLQRLGWIPELFNCGILWHTVRLYGTKHHVVGAEVIDRPIFIDSKGFARQCASWQLDYRENDDDKPTKRSHKRWRAVQKRIASCIEPLRASHVFSFTEVLHIDKPESILICLRGWSQQPDTCSLPDFSKEPYLYEPMLLECDA